MTCCKWLTVAVAYLAVTSGFAGDGGPLREARSANRRFVLRIEPGRAGRTDAGCEATLHGQREDGGARRRLWERPLVNDMAPEQAYIRDDGRFVVTLNEFRHGGARNAVVIYGERGELLRHFLLTDLLDKDDWKHVAVGRQELTWLKDARCGFEDAADEFVIEFKWGRKLRIDLKTLQVVREGQQAVAALLTVPPEMLAVMLGHLQDDGQQSVAERLAQVGEMTPEEQAQAAAVANALSPDAKAEGGLPEEVDPTADALARTDDTTTQPAEQPDAQAAELAAATEAAEPAPLASAVGDIPVPMPNPGQPVDYVAWLNDLGRVEGADAGPLYDIAAQEFAGWQGDNELIRAALNGDPEALQSPEVQAWLEQNERAMAEFRDASRYANRGWNYNSPDGSLLGVMLPSLSSLRHLGRATVIAGREQAAAGEPVQAAATYLDALAAGGHVGTGMTIIENLVGVAMQQPAADALLDLQAEPDADEIDFADLAQAAEAAYRQPRPIAETIQGERAFLLDTVQRIWTKDPDTGRTVLNPQKANEIAQALADGSDTQISADDLANMSYENTVTLANQYWDAMTAASELPYPEARQRFNDLREWATSPENPEPLLRKFVPDLGRYLLATTRAETTRRASLLVTRLNAFRQAHGDYPSDLNDLGTPDLTIDPFVDAPFVYQRTAEGFRLYSVGNNGVDDGGVHDAKGETNDMVYWPRPAK